MSDGTGSLILLQTIGVDAHRFDIAMGDKFLSVLSQFGVVEEAIGINAFRPILKQSMAKNVRGAIMIVAPYKGNSQPVIVFERIRKNRPSIGALNSSSTRPTLKVRF